MTRSCNEHFCPEPEPEPEPEAALRHLHRRVRVGRERQGSAASSGTDANDLVGWTVDAEQSEGAGYRLVPQQRLRRVVSVSIRSGALTSCRYRCVCQAARSYAAQPARQQVEGDISSLSSLVELRWLDVQQTSVYGLMSSLTSLQHLGECWLV